MPDLPFAWNWQGARQSVVRTTIPVDAIPGRPVIVLLHGTSGTIDDMAAPAVHPGFNHETVPDGTFRDRGWHAQPNAGAWSVELTVWSR